MANGKVLLNTPFKIYIQSAAGDAGGAIGAALTTLFNVDKIKLTKISPHSHAYWGPSFKDEEIEKAINLKRDKIEIEKCDINYFSNNSELTKRTAKEIAEGKVIGWFQGSMEWGPRALGNRSIICDPRRSDMKEILNIKIKRRAVF